MSKHILQVTLLKEGGLVHDESTHNDVLHGIALAGINCVISINKKTSTDAIIIEINKQGEFRYSGTLNDTPYKAPLKNFNGYNLAKVLNMHILRIDDVGYLKEDLYVFNMYGKMKYGFSDTKRRTGENCVIITPIFSCIYNISRAKNLGKILRVASYYAGLHLGRLYGLKATLISMDGIKHDYTIEDIPKNKNYIVIRPVIKIIHEPLSSGKFKSRLYKISLSHITAVVRFKSDKRYIDEYVTPSLCSNISDFTGEHIFSVEANRKKYEDFLGHVKNYILKNEKLLGGVKKHFIKGIDEVIAEHSSFIGFSS